MFPVLQGLNGPHWTGRDPLVSGPAGASSSGHKRPPAADAGQGSRPQSKAAKGAAAVLECVRRGAPDGVEDDTQQDTGAGMDLDGVASQDQQVRGHR